MALLYTSLIKSNILQKEKEKNQKFQIEMFYLNSTLNFGIPAILVFQLEVYFKVDRIPDWSNCSTRRMLDGIQIQINYMFTNFYLLFLFNKFHLLLHAKEYPSNQNIQKV